MRVEKTARRTVLLIAENELENEILKALYYKIRRMASFIDFHVNGDFKAVMELKV